jgi:hypothetical protein
MPEIPAVRRLRQEDQKFKASLSCIKQTNKQINKTLSRFITMYFV